MLAIGEIQFLGDGQQCQHFTKSDSELAQNNIIIFMYTTAVPVYSQHLISTRTCTNK